MSLFEYKHARECLRLLLLTIFLPVRIICPREESASKDVEADGAFTKQTMHQQFERLSFMFEEIKDRMDRQDAAIATLQRRQPQRGPNVRRHGRRNSIPIYDFVDDNEIMLKMMIFKHLKLK